MTLKETLTPTENLTLTGDGHDPTCQSPAKMVSMINDYVHPTANLADLASLLALTPNPCSPSYQVLECGCGRRIVRKGCMNARCPKCSTLIKNRRGSQAFKRFHLPFKGEDYRDNFPTVCYTVFTIPPEIRHKFADYNEWQKVRKAVCLLLKTKFKAVYGVMGSHPIGDSEEKSEFEKSSGRPFFHPHIDALWKTYLPRDAFINVELLNKCWAEILGVPLAVAHHEYTDNRYQLLHWCLYALRPFPEYAQWQGSIRWFGAYPVMPKKKAQLCPCCGKPIIAIGTIDKEFIDDYDKFGFQMGRDPPWMIEDNINRYKRKSKIVK